MTAMILVTAALAVLLVAVIVLDWAVGKALDCEDCTPGRRRN